MKLIKQDIYLLLIDEEAEVCRGQHRFLNNKVELIHEGHNYPYKGNKVIAYYPLNSEAKELDLPLLPNPFKTLESLYKQPNIKKKPYNNIALKAIEEARIESFLDGHFYGFEEGYKAAQSKQFSLEDIKKAIEMARTGYGYNGNINVADTLENDGYGGHIDNFDKEFIFKTPEEIIQSLPTQQLPKEFIPEPNEIWLILSEWFGKNIDKKENNNFTSNNDKIKAKGFDLKTSFRNIK